ncbi:HsdR family type I site-specific deoxyribonuclease [Pseudoalteromonas sp. 3-MNA-CIBAN-0064]|uniref:type I restriction endonuclease subunit R n=2 Tax=Gammaproteobacteria TaxID=1236 RepID=UPI00332925EE
MKFTEAKLEQAVVELLGEQGYPHLLGGELNRNHSDVLIKDDLRAFLTKRYAKNNITTGEVDSIIAKLEKLPASDLYESNKTFCKWLSDGFLLKREVSRERGMVAGSAAQKDLYVQLLDYDNVEQGIKSSLIAGSAMAALGNMALDNVNEASVTYLQDDNIYRFVTQLEIESPTSYDNIELRIPDGILYVNGLPLVVFEFKSAIREQAPIFEAYEQLTVRYRRAIPQLFVFNTLCVISDGVNNKMGNLFAPYQFFYSWGKITGQELTAQEGINSLHTLLQGLFDKARLRDVMRNFIFFPDSDNKNAGKKEIKIVPRYPQYYAANKLFENIKRHLKPKGDGKGGTYFGATGCGKSYTMQFLTRLLMKSVELKSPTIILITDRTDLDDQLSQQFGNAKTYIGDDTVKTVTSRTHLRELLEGRNSGGVFLTTIHKFTEDTRLLTDRTNVICISDEAHRSQVNLDQKITITEKGVKKTFGFAKYLHDSLPNATYVGFTGTPVDATLDVFGEVVDSYTMTESVKDEITVRIVYEGRAAKVCLNNSKLAEIEAYYKECADAGSNELQIEDSKKATANMNSILGDPDRIKVLAKDFVQHYEKRVDECSTVAGKAMFVCSSRGIAYQLYQELEELRPQWFDVVDSLNEQDNAQKLSDTERKRAISEGRIAAPSEKVKMVMTRGKDDVERLYNLLGSKDERKELDKQFKNKNSNFKIAIVVDMWLTGFDVPFLDTMYIDKPLQKHSLIQTISRVNRQFEGKDKGLVVDYIGIKSEMNKALAQYSKTDETNFEDITASVIEVKNHLALLAELFHKFDSSAYFTGEAVAQLNCLNHAAEFALITEKRQKRFMDLVKRLKAAYDVCCGSEKINENERNHIHFYLAIRSIIYKLTKGEAPDTAQMNAKVREMISEALQSDGVEEVFKLGNEDGGEIDIFNDDYIAKIEKIKLPNTKIKILQQMLAKAIGELKKVNQTQGIDFTKRFESLVQRYNERKEDDVLVSSVLDEFSESMVDMIYSVRNEMNAGDELGIDIEEKGFYDALKALAVKYDFDYPEDKLIELAQAVKVIVDDKVKFVDWNNRDDIKSALKVELILVLAKFKYPPISHDEVYKEIFEQAQNVKANKET